MMKVESCLSKLRELNSHNKFKIIQSLSQDRGRFVEVHHSDSRVKLLFDFNSELFHMI